MESKDNLSSFYNVIAQLLGCIWEYPLIGLIFIALEHILIIEIGLPRISRLRTNCCIFLTFFSFWIASTFFLGLN